MVTIPSGRRSYTRVTVEHPDAPTPDGEGGWSNVWSPGVPPVWDVAIAPAAGLQERVTAAGGFVDTSLVTVVGPYRADITTRSRLVRSDGSILSVQSVAVGDGRPFELTLVCAGN